MYYLMFSALPGPFEQTHEAVRSSQGIVEKIVLQGAPPLPGNFLFSEAEVMAYLVNESETYFLYHLFPTFAGL